MAETKLAPLSTQVPIVDEHGNPTPYFQQLMQIFIDEKNATADDVTVIGTEIDNLTLDDLVDVDTTTTTPTDGQALVFDDGTSLWVPGDVASGGGGGAPWEIIYTNSAITNPTTNIDIDVSNYQEILVIGRAITASASGYRSVLVSTDGGTSFYNTAGDYVAVLNTGGEGSTFTAGNHETSSSSARDCGIHACGINLNGNYKLLRHITTGGAHRIFAANTSPITHIRICTFAASGGALANMTGGSVYVIGIPISVNGAVSSYEAAPVDVPVVADFTWNNQGSATATDSAMGGIVMDGVAASTQVKQLEIALPATPFSLYVNCRHILDERNVSNGFGISFRNSTSGRLHLFYVNTPSATEHQILMQRWSSVSVFASTQVNQTISHDTHWFRCDVTSTGTTNYASSNGVDWVEIGSETWATYMEATGGTVDNVGIFIIPAAIPMVAWFPSFGFTAPTG